MLKLLKLAMGLCAFLAFSWFGSTVKLGPRTLFEHLHAIGQTKESQELVDGTKHAAEPLVDDVRRRIAGRAAAAVAENQDREPPAPQKPPALGPDAGAPEETVSRTDKRQLRRLIGAAERPTARR